MLNASDRKRQITLISITIAIPLLLLLAIAIINVLVDPYEIMPYRTFGSDQKRKPFIVDQSFFIKAIGIIKEKPQYLLLGTSVIDRGFFIPGSTEMNLYPNPEVFTPKLTKRYYNAGIRGGGLAVIKANFYHAYRNNPKLSHVIIGLDWSYFTEPAKPKVPNSKAQGQTHIPLSIYFERTISWQSINDSYFCLVSNNAVMRRLHNMFIKQFKGWQNKIALTPYPLTQLNYFLEIQRVFSTPLSHLYYSIHFATRNVNRLPNNSSYDSSAIKDIKEIVNFCQQHHLKLDIFIEPHPAIYWETLQKLQIQSKVDTWLKELASITPFWDFSDLIDYSEEVDQYFTWDIIHFHPKVGKIILEKIVNSDRIKEPHYINSDTIERHITQRKLQLTNWIAKHREIQNLFVTLNITPNYNLSQFPLVYPRINKDIILIKFEDKFYAFPQTDKHYQIQEVIRGKNKDIMVRNTLSEIIQAVQDRDIKHALRT